MVGVVICVSLGLCISGILWKRRRRGRTDVTPASATAMSHETLALQVFAHGNRRLAAGRFDEARAAFHQVLELNPRHPDVAGRLATVERQRHAQRRGFA